MGWWELWRRRRHRGRKTYSLWWSLHGKSFPNIILKWLQRPVCISFQHTSLILSGSCDHFGSGTREWISILKTRLLIQPKTRRPFRRMWWKNTASNTDVCRSLNPKRTEQNLSFSAIASKSGQSCYDPYDLSSNDEEYLLPDNVAEMAPGRSDHAAHLLKAAMLDLNSPPEFPQNWRQCSPNLHDYNSDSIEISRTFRLPHITNWWRQRDETHSMYADLSDVAHDILLFIPQNVGVEDSFSLGRDVIGWRQSRNIGDSLRKNVVVRQFAWANIWLLGGGDPVLDANSTDNDMEMKREAEEKKLQRMAKVHNVLEMWQGSQNLWATQKESRTQNEQMTPVGYISDTEEIVKAFWSNFQHNGAAAFKLSEKSPVPPAWSA